MALISSTSPHTTVSNNTGAFMRQVIYATLPGLAVLTWQFGWGTVINVLWAVVVALVSEALILKARGRPVAFYLKDYSAVLTAVLLALALPPTSPWWLTLIGVGFAIIVAKQLYGGLGMNELDFVLLAQECGRVALCEPLVETALVATPLLACQAQRDTRCATLLEKIASGERRVAVGHAVNPTVSDAHIADYLLLPSGNEYHLVERERVTLIPLQSVDPSRRLFKVD